MKQMELKYYNIPSNPYVINQHQKIYKINSKY